MKNPNTTAGQRLLSFVQDYYAKNRAMPSFAEIGKLVGLSVSTVAFHVNSLKEHGFLDATDTGRLTPGKAFFKRTLVSTVRAGLPAYADDSSPEGMLIDQYLIDTPSRTFLLTVKGESMQDAGLLPGDVVIVKRGAIAAVGDIVVVDANGEGTVKELAQHPDGEYFLKARNIAYPNIVPADGFEIVGVVVGQFRRYNRSKPVAHPALQVVEDNAASNLNSDTGSDRPIAKVSSTFVGTRGGKRVFMPTDGLKVATPGSQI